MKFSNFVFLLIRVHFNILDGTGFRGKLFFIASEAVCSDTVTKKQMGQIA